MFRLISIITIEIVRPTFEPLSGTLESHSGLRPFESKVIKKGSGVRTSRTPGRNRLFWFETTTGDLSHNSENAGKPPKTGPSVTTTSNTVAVLLWEFSRQFQNWMNIETPSPPHWTPLKVKNGPFAFDYRHTAKLLITKYRSYFVKMWTHLWYNGYISDSWIDRYC